jgi:hypothetical protein
MFTIQLIENEDGRVSALADMVGSGMNAMEIGMEIMQKLSAAAKDNPDRLAVQVITHCRTWQ